MRGGMTTMLDDAVAKCRAGADHRAPRFSASRRCGEPMPNYRYRALNSNGEWSPARSRRRRRGEVAQPHRVSRLVLVDNVT